MISAFLQWCEAACLADAGPPRLKICDSFADVPVRNQFGESLRFHERFVAPGRALILNTMFTTCRGSCPGTGTVIESLRTALWPVFGNRLSIVSLSIEPAVDTPERLLAYSVTYGADRPRKELCEWQFLTGTPADIEKLRRSLGFYDLNPRIDRDPTQHAAAIMFGNSTSDRWAVLPAELPEPLLIATIRRMAGFSFEERYGIRG
jgi:protein SCO1/2